MRILNEEHSRDAWLSRWSSKHLVTGSIEIQARPIDPYKEGKVFVSMARRHTWRRGCIAPLIFILGTRYKRVVNFTPRSLCPRKEFLRYPFNRKLGTPQDRSGRFGEEENILHLLAFEPRFVKLVTVTITRFPQTLIIIIIIIIIKILVYSATLNQTSCSG